MHDNVKESSGTETTFCNKVKCQLMQLGNFIDVFLARHVSDTYAHHQEH